MNDLVRHEPQGIDVQRVGRLAVITAGVFLLALVVSLVIWIFWYRASLDAGAPAAAHVAQPPAPIGLKDLRARHERLSRTYGWIDRDAGIARIPVRRAMVLLATGEADAGTDGREPPR